MTLLNLPAPNFTGADLSGRVNALLTRARGDLVHVADHGAIGDGLADDSAAILAAIAAADGAPVWFAPGTYRAGALGATTLAGDATLWAAPGTATLLAPTAVHGLTIAGAGASLRVRGLTFQGFDRALRGLDDGAELALVDIQDCEFSSCVRGASFYKAAHFRVERSRAYGPAALSQVSQMGFHCDQPARATVTGNETFWLAGYGIMLGNNSATAQSRSNYVVSRNHCHHIHNSAASGEAHGILCYGFDVSITDNTVVEVTNGGGGTGDEGIYAKAVRLQVALNRVLNGGRSNDGAIAIKGADLDVARPFSPANHESYDQIVAHNVIEFQPAYLSQGVAIHSHQRRTHIEGNHCVRGRILAEDAGIVRGNTFRDTFPFLNVDAIGNCIIEDNKAYGTAPTGVNATVNLLRVTVTAHLGQLVVRRNVVDMDMNGWAPASFYAFALFANAGAAYAVPRLELSGNRFAVANMTMPATSGPLMFSAASQIAHGDYEIFDNDLPRGLVGPDNLDKVFVRARGNKGAVAQTQLHAEPALSAGTTAGRVRTTNAVAFSVGGVRYSKPATDDLWDLSALTTAAGEYRKVLLMLSPAGTASIRAGTPAASEYAAELPYRQGNCVAVGYVNLGPSYAGGAIPASSLVPFLTGDGWA